MQNLQSTETICALSTAPGMGAIAIIRVSGSQSFSIVEAIFSKSIADKTSHTAHFGKIVDGDDIIDEVLVTIFKNPGSFTGEDSAEIACHGSVFIQKSILELLLKHGARLAKPGEFSMRAFMNGKMDLSQTEAVADLIASTSKAQHNVAINQMRGGFSNDLKALRQKLMDFASLVELELDFSEEDVEFADRSQLEALVKDIKTAISHLIQSFKLGNVIKNGVPVAIVGIPNSGKSTLLNTLLNEDKAIVSDIAGTTRDVIEDEILIDDITYRFIDTAGIRKTTDEIENMGIKRAFEQVKKAEIILLIVDLVGTTAADIIKDIDLFRGQNIQSYQTLIPVFNKIDQVDLAEFKELESKGVFLSAKFKTNKEDLMSALSNAVGTIKVEDQTIVTNVRHFEALTKSNEFIERVESGLQSQIPGDLLAMDIRQTLYHLGEITGSVSNDELLGNIFANFCIGK
ncbi:MAG: tRNA uridine-5-carboxymethylaminomethyl(34) synthesis GTPase MnmE [Crocinitomicaceae bacterium]